MVNEAHLRRLRNMASYLRTGLDTASGVATPPMALILCCMVGVAEDVVRFPVPILGTVDCCICWTDIDWSGDNASAVYVLWRRSGLVINDVFNLIKSTCVLDADWIVPDHTSAHSAVVSLRCCCCPSAVGRNCFWSHVAGVEAVSVRNPDSAMLAAPCRCRALDQEITEWKIED